MPAIQPQVDGLSHVFVDEPSRFCRSSSKALYDSDTTPGAVVGLGDQPWAASKPDAAVTCGNARPTGIVFNFCHFIHAAWMRPLEATRSAIEERIARVAVTKQADGGVRRAACGVLLAPEPKGETRGWKQCLKWFGENVLPVGERDETDSTSQTKDTVAR